MDTKNLFILSGPSGAGEDSVIDGLEKLFPIERVVTTTTRSMRKEDSEGHPYYFITRADFERGISKGKFFEWARQYNDNLYGVTHEEIRRVVESGRVGIWKIDYQGVITAKKLFPNIIAIMLTAPPEVMEARIRRRDTVTEAFIQDRMNYTQEWMKHTDIYDSIVENEEGKLDQTIEKVAAIIKENQT
jgi:guanylate kinase